MIWVATIIPSPSLIQKVDTLFLLFLSPKLMSLVCQMRNVCVFILKNFSVRFWIFIHLHCFRLFSDIKETSIHVTPICLGHIFVGFAFGYVSLAFVVQVGLDWVVCGLSSLQQSLWRFNFLSTTVKYLRIGFPWICGGVGGLRYYYYYYG